MSNVPNQQKGQSFFPQNSSKCWWRQTRESIRDYSTTALLCWTQQLCSASTDWTRCLPGNISTSVEFTVFCILLLQWLWFSSSTSKTLKRISTWEAISQLQDKRCAVPNKKKLESTRVPYLQYWTGIVNWWPLALWRYYGEMRCGTSRLRLLIL